MEKNIWKNEEKKHNHGEKIILGMDPLRCDHNIIVWEVMPPTKVTYERTLFILNCLWQNGKRIHACKQEQI